jgi:hypothetical protein
MNPIALLVITAIPTLAFAQDAKTDIQAVIKKLESNLSSEVIAGAKEMEKLGPEAGKEAIPALIQAFKNASFSDSVKATAKAIGKMGPAAKDAVPVMIERLKKLGLPAERIAIVEGLGDLGPVAKDALPHLNVIARNTLGEERQAALTAIRKIQAKPKP